MVYNARFAFDAADVEFSSSLKTKMIKNHPSHYHNTAIRHKIYPRMTNDYYPAGWTTLRLMYVEYI